MNVAELERLLEQVSQGNWISKEGDKTLIINVDVSGFAEAMALRKLMTAAPSLARRVIAAEKLAEAVMGEREMVCQDYDLQRKASEAVDAALTAYEATK